jgi:hypothetical protein
MTESFKNTCLAIMQLAMETPKERAHIMCGWVAHCDHFEVRLFLGGWRTSASPDFAAECHDIEAKGFTPDYHYEPMTALTRIRALLA